jgi:hypothetical protein
MHFSFCLARVARNFGRGIQTDSRGQDEAAGPVAIAAPWVRWLVAHFCDGGAVFVTGAAHLGVQLAGALHHPAELIRWTR